ncbi:hypothetical protein CCU68_18200 [Pseudomonas gingeri NCPPB 3146 = LMG 5327]|uniref:Uncharacterized protein n=2 Tax=Pseudomonas gingeri TaxID=117681 RepID=A0A7Y7Y2E7_9PSED|nr:hypothetical protein [Pseudomonas gingeri]NVZ63657.1 hypothetical protein [Pseudomonas gingeri]NWC16490.1 hypothetical protein [Pseudomonas gingeri]PNQ91148.1 hypothetical protein CCU68_18200 [Pseudomonas gingeri NCPPB 3146 = LMG 5327]
MHSSASAFPSIPANASFEDSSVVHAHRTGINPVELDALAQAIGRLARDHSTVVPASMKGDMLELVQLGYVELTNTTCGTLSVDLVCAGALLSSYFWSVWIPRHLQRCALQMAVMPHLEPKVDVQHCTVIFRVPGPREATRQFLHDLGTHFPGDEAEIIVIQVGNALAGDTSRLQTGENVHA